MEKRKNQTNRSSLYGEEAKHPVRIITVFLSHSSSLSVFLFCLFLNLISLTPTLSPFLSVCQSDYTISLFLSFFLSVSLSFIISISISFCFYLTFPSVPSLISFLLKLSLSDLFTYLLITLIETDLGPEL
jgi:hypothetical protein